MTIRHLLAFALCAACAGHRAQAPLDRPDATSPPPASEVEARIPDIERLAGPQHEFEIVKNLVFAPRSDATARRLDLYLPSCPGPHPIAVVIPGNAWRFGNRRHFDTTTLAEALAREGVASAAISYRAAPQRAHPAQIEDCRDAVRWLRDNADEYELDVEHMAAIGASAGGHLAALLGTQDGHGTKPACVVALSSPLDLRRREEEPPSQAQIRILCDFLGLPLDRAEELGADGFMQELERRARTASPREFVDASDSPFLLMHTHDDPIVPLGHAQRMHERLQSAGVASQLVTEPGGHVAYFFGLMHVIEEGMRERPPFWTTVRHFLAEHLLPDRD